MKPEPILSSSPLDLGSTAELKTGCGKMIGSNLRGFSLTARVSLVFVSCNLAKVPISPATNSVTASCLLPLGTNKLVMRSAFPLLTFHTGVSLLMVPEITLNMVNLPTKGSAIVLNTKATKGPSAS